jgi:hypothetical protein
MIKKKSKKLSLSSETLRNLSEPDLKEAAGQASAMCSAVVCSATHVCSNCRPCF